MRRVLAFLFLLLAIPASAQQLQPVTQLGTITPGHVAMWATTGIIQDAGISTQGKLTTIGVTGSGLQDFCATSGLVTSPYSQLCIGFASGVPTITTSGQTAGSSLVINLNGAVFTLPGSASCLGCGTMSGQNANAVAITGGTIAGVAITGSTIATTSIASPTITTPTVTGGSFTNGSFAAPAITGGTMVGTGISSGTMNGTTVVNGTITGAAISGGTMSGTAISGGTMTNTTITGGSFALTTASSIQGQTTGSITTDETQLLVGLNNPTLTANYILGCALGACGQPEAAADAIRGVATQTSGSTDITVSSVGGYTLNNRAGGAATQAALALWGVAICAVNNCQTWGLSTITTDVEGFTGPTSGTGRQVYGHEADLNISSPNTQGIGFFAGGTFLTTGANTAGFQTNVPSGGIGAQWENAFVASDGSAATGLYLGRSATGGANLNSVPISFQWSDGSSHPKFDIMYGTNDGIAIDSASGAPFTGNLILHYGAVLLPSNQGIIINDNVILSADSGANAFYASGASFTSVNIGNNTATIVMNGPTKLSSVTVGALPVCNAGLNGSMMAVIDAASPAWNTTLTGGGGSHVPVFCDGSVWTAH